MMPSDTTALPPPPQGPSLHRGSASTNLSGWTVLTAWILSIGVHAVVFFGMLLLVFRFSSRENMENLPVTHVELVGPIDGTSTVNTAFPKLPAASPTPEPPVERYRPKASVRLSKLSAPKKPDLSIIGIGAGGGDFEQYGFQIGSAAAPQFFGLGGSARGARKIIYVVDISGSMLETFVYVQAELKRSISALRRSQKFHVIFFSQGPVQPNPPRKLVSAIEATKQQFFKFLDGITPHGGTQPGPALKRALEMKPDLIYLLSDGQDFPPELFRKLDQWNRNRRVRICTIAYIDPVGSELLERIAREHHGEFTFVSEDDLP